MMNFQEWYSEEMEVYRMASYQDGGLTLQRRERVGESPIPCRRFRQGRPGLRLTAPAAAVGQEDYVQCGLGADVRAGDELRIGGRRFLAGEPERFTEPFGAVMPGLAHQEIPITEEETVS